MVRSSVLILLALAAAAPVVWADEATPCPFCRAPLIEVAADHHLCRKCSCSLRIRADGRAVASRREDGRRRTYALVHGNPVAVGHPVNRPAAPVTRPAAPVGLPSAPVARPSHPVQRPADPVARPSHPVARSGHPVARPAHSVTRSRHPVQRPGHAVNRPGRAVERAGHPVMRGGHPIEGGNRRIDVRRDPILYAPVARSGPATRSVAVRRYSRAR